MRRVFITGSADGLGLLAGKRLAAGGHRVTLHARSEKRAADARKALPTAEHIVVGDVATFAEMRRVADQVNALGPYDAVIHNVAIGYQEPSRVETSDGIERLFAINVLAPHVLSALITRPKRLVYLSSGLHQSGRGDLRDPQWKTRSWNGTQAYSDSKLFNVMQAFALARIWPDVRSNALEPGWVPTRMGGAHAPDDLALGALTQAWLAASEDEAAAVSGEYFFHQKRRAVHAKARDPQLQDALLEYCESVSAIRIERP